MIRMTGLNKFVRKTEAQKRQIKVGAAEFVRRGTRAILRDLVLNTPQWSGNMAASWRIDLNYMPASEEPSALYEADWTQVEPTKFRGDELAWRVALNENKASLAAIKWNAQVRIVNVHPFAGELATDPQAEAMLRPGNFIPGDVMAVKLVSLKYKIFSNEVGLALKGQFSNEP